MAIDPNFLEMEWQNGFEATLDDRVVLTDEYIPMTPVPEGDFGRLVLEDTSKENFEVIRYNRKDAGGIYVETADGGLRNEDGTSSGVHPRGARVRGNITAQDLREMRQAAKDVIDEFDSFMGNLPDWRTLLTPPNAVVYNGNRSSSLTIPGANYTNVLSKGMRLRLTRTVAAPNRSTLLNGSNQYWNKTAPNKLAFTNNFVITVNIKPTAYASGVVVARFNGTNGWYLRFNANGTVELTGFNGGGGNYRGIVSIAALPLNEWTQVTVQLDMAGHAVSPTVSYVMFNGVEVPATVFTNGTNPTALVPAGDLEVGRTNGVAYFPGKIAQVGIFSAKVPQATMRGYMTQGLLGNEPNLASAWSFNGVATDLNTSTPNDLTPQNGAVSTEADSPFGIQGDGTISTTLEYAIIMGVSFAGGNTSLVVQSPEGGALPVVGGISAMSYSVNDNPYNFPAETTKWEVKSIYYGDSATSGTGGTIVWLKAGLTVPIGAWGLSNRGAIFVTCAGSAINVSLDLNTAPSNAPAINDKSQFREAIYDVATGATNRETMSIQQSEGSVILAAAATFNMFARSNGINAPSLSVRGDFAPFIIKAVNAYV